MRRYQSIKQLWLLMLVLLTGITAAAAVPDDDFDPAPPGDPNQMSFVTVVSSPTAASTVSGAGQYRSGQSVTIKTTANSAYKFQHWSINGYYYSTSTSFRYTVGDSAANFVAHYVARVYRSLSLAATPEEGATTSCSQGGSIEAGTSVTVKATPASGFVFLGWYKGNERLSTSKNYTFAMPDEDLLLVAKLEFDPTAPADPDAKIPVTVKTNPAGAATVSGSGQFSIGANTTIAISNIQAGYTFTKWTLNGADYSTAQSFSYTVTDDDASFVAHFTYEEPPTPTYRKLYLIADPADAGIFNKESGLEVAVGSTIECKVTRNTDFRFLGWYLDNVLLSTSQSYTLSMPDHDVTLTAKLEYEPGTPGDPKEQRYTLTYKIDDNVAKSESLAAGDPIVAYMPDERSGYVFSGWVDLPQYMPQHDVTVSGRYIDVHDLKYVVKSAAESHGRVDRSIANDTILSGQRLALTAVADEHYHFDHWNDGSTVNPLEFLVSKDDSITAYFAINTHTITYKVGAVIVNTETYEYGATIATYTPDIREGYYFSGWTGLPSDMLMPDEDLVVKGSLSDTPFFLIGDINNDGQINVTDLVCMARYILELPNPGCIREAADMDSNGIINVIDYARLASVILDNNNE